MTFSNSFLFAFLFDDKCKIIHYIDYKILQAIVLDAIYKNCACVTRSKGCHFLTLSFTLSISLIIFFEAFTHLHINTYRPLFNLSLPIHHFTTPIKLFLSRDMQLSNSTDTYAMVHSILRIN